MFFISLIMILISSYLILSVLSGKTKTIYPFLYLGLIVFSQIIISVEFLSLFKIISRNNYLISNVCFLLITSCLFVKTKSKLYIPEISFELTKIKYALKSDKLLSVCLIGFIVFIISDIAIIFSNNPPLFPDALSYYFPRALNWISSGSINHFLTPDSRALIMPVNFDILYMLHFLFFRTEKGISIYSFIGFLFTLNVLYLFVKEIFYSRRRAFWCVFVFSSFALVGLQCVLPVADLTSGGLLLSTLFLFLISLKSKDYFALYFSSLAFALSIGVKTTSLICAPGIISAFILYIAVYNPISIKKFVLRYLIFFILNFIIFSSYNYILNLIDFNNFLSNAEHILLNGLRGGFPAVFCNITKYCFMIFDTSGINTGYFGGFIMHLQSLFLGMFGFTDISFTSNRFPGYFYFNSAMNINSSFLGLTGMIAFLPAFIKSVKSCSRKKKNTLIFILTICLIINVIVLSSSMVFTSFNNRYLFTMIILSSPILLYSYTKKNTFCKILIVISLLWYFGLNFNSYIQDNFINRENKMNDEKLIYEQLKNISGENIGLSLNNTQTDVYYMVKPVLTGFKVSYILPEILNSFDLKQYDVIVSDKRDISSDFVYGNYKITNKNYNCDYVDVDGYLTEPGNKNIPVGIVCDNPVRYYIDNGFAPFYETERFIILKRNS